MLERWIKFLAKPPKHYSYLRDWQDMVKCGGTLEQAQFLADNFQNLVLSVARDAAALKEENDIIKAKAGVRKKPRRDAYPNEFETNDQFCPGCDLELKTMPIEPTNLYLDLYKADLDSENDQKPDPGLLSLHGLGVGAAFFGGSGRACRDLASRNRRARKKPKRHIRFCMA